MTWNVFYSNFNSGKIESYNVLKGREKFIRNLRKKSSSKKDFAKELRSEMMYHYWGRAEWEILISPWCGREGAKELKVDVFAQLNLNWDRFVDYCWKIKN